jgi:hypothetical protein
MAAAVEIGGAKLTIADEPIPTMAKLLLETGRGAPEDEIVATWPDGPNMLPAKLSSFTRDRPPPHSYAVPTYYRR